MKFHLYADDTQLFLNFDSSVPSSSDAAIIQLESCITEIRAWMLANKLKLNDDKTEFLRFLPNRSMSDEKNQNPLICIGADRVSLSAHAKNLGVIMDPSLSLSSHITSTCKAANFHLYRLSRIRKYLTPEALKTAVRALISSKLDYCNSLFIGLPLAQITRLQNIINSAARLISGVKKFDHITPTLKELHWLPIERRIEFKLLCMTFKALNGQAPQYLIDLVKIYIPSRALRSSEQGLLCVPKIRTKKFGTRAFEYAAPVHYNALPLDIHRSTSLDMFKSKLKTHLFRKS